MLTGLLLGVQISSVQTTSPHRAADHASADPSRQAHDDIDRIGAMRAIDVDAIHPNVGGVDIVGSPILSIDDDVLAAFDRTIEACDINVENREASFDGSHDSDGDDDLDWPHFVRGSTDESSRELRLYADDPERMSAAGLIPGSRGALAPSVPDDILDLFRQRDPSREGSVDFYVL